MSYIQNYPLASPLKRIFSHDQLPSGAVELARVTDNTAGRDKVYILVKQNRHLAILMVYRNVKTQKYHCKQVDFPIKVLSWFPLALENFRKPPADHGLHAGAMVSKDVDVDGEMLVVGRTTDGYDLTNRSRTRYESSGYEPMRISLSSKFLYELGFLDLWKNLGLKFERGEL